MEAVRLRRHAVVECALPARAFADALAEAVRELEACGARVVEMTRIWSL